MNDKSNLDDEKKVSNEENAIVNDEENKVTVEPLKENINVQKNKANKKTFAIVLVFILLFCVVVGAFILGKNMSSTGEKKEDNVEQESDDISNENIKYKDYVSDYELVKLSDLSGAAKLYINDIESGNDTVEFTGYDGYYIVNDNNTFYLKRKQNVVSEIEKNIFKVYKDSTDVNSKYITVVCSDQYCRFSNAVSEEYAYFFTIEKSIILNVNTGENKIFDGIVRPVLGIDKVVFTHSSNTNGSSLVSLEDFSLMSLDSPFLIKGNDAFLSQEDAVYSKSEKYIVVATSPNYDAKYGLYDYQMNKKIDFIYDDLNTISDDLLIAKKDNKFGVIDSSNKKVIDFIYDGIEYVDNFYVVIKDGKLGVLDKNGNVVVPFNYSVPKEKEFTLRPCCLYRNAFEVFDKGDKILISYFDSTRELKDSLYGFYESYIILNKDGTYSKVDFNTKIYNFSEKLYYYDAIENGFNLYDSERNLYKSIKCSGSVHEYPRFVYKDVIHYSCSNITDNDVISWEDFYYNVKTNKEANSEDVKSIDSTDVEYGKVYTYTFGNETGVYTLEKKLLLKLDNGDKFTLVYDDIYKNVKADGSVEYYKLIS